MPTVRLKKVWSYLTRQRVAASSFRVIAPAAELPALLGAALLYVVLAGLAARMIQTHALPLFHSPDFLLDAWYSLVFKTGTMLILPALAFLLLGYGWRDLAPTGVQTRDFVWSVVAYALGFAVNLSYWGAVQKQLTHYGWAALAAPIATAWLLALINAGLSEEFVFRYWLQTRLEQRAGRGVALVSTALLFAAWHIPSRYLLSRGAEGQAGHLGDVLLNTGVPVLIVGLFLGWSWDRHRRLLPLVALHWGIDTLPLVAGMLGITR